MKRPVVWLGMLLIALTAAGGFKAKTVRPKKPEKFQVRVVSSGITFAADLLLDGKDQAEFFFKGLSPSNVIAVRRAIFNGWNAEVVMPLDGIQLVGRMARKSFLWSLRSWRMHGLGHRPSSTKGFELRVLKGKGISEPVILRFP